MPCKKKIILFCLLIFSFFSAFCKSTFGSDKEWGHTNDVSKVLTGKRFEETNIKMKALGYLLYLTVDATKGEYKPGKENPGQVINAFDYFEKHKEEFRLKNPPNVDVFCTPGGPSHGYYTHLGWNHKYPFQNGFDNNKNWLERKTFFINTIKENFKISSKKQADNFAALIYYIHILGDHEWDEESTNVTRIPVNRRVREDGFMDEQHPGWRAETTIVDELLDILPNIFRKQKKTLEYELLVNSITRMKFNTFDPQPKRAKYLLNTLQNSIPQLIEREGFAKDFFN